MSDALKILLGLGLPNKYGFRLVSIISVIVCICSYYAMLSMSTTLKKDVPEVSARNPMKRILLWNGYFSHRHFNFGVGRKPFVNAGCVNTRCHITDRDDSRAPVEEFDAVVFHGWNLVKNDLPLKRSPHQRYVLYAMEPPGIFPNNLQDLPPGFFNWTLTFRLDSDIPGSYGYFKTLTKPEKNIIPPIENWIDFPIDFKESDLPESTRTKIGNKTKLVAWFVSHCKTPGRREDYVEELKKYISVDVYGRCGSFLYPVHEKDTSFANLENDYKFYLSFENSICHDYVTEKLFGVMKYNVVPIVFGGGNYSAMAPPGSYIHVKDFSHPWLLAQYLMDLDANPQDYARFFWWKTYYEPQATNTHHFCGLCALLHNKDAPQKDYSDIREWYEANGTCQSIADYTNGLFSN